MIRQGDIVRLSSDKSLKVESVASGMVYFAWNDGRRRTEFMVPLEFVLGPNNDIEPEEVTEDR